MSGALWLVLALQASPSPSTHPASPRFPRPPTPDVRASVDRRRLASGEELTLTVRARTRSAEPVGIVLPSLTGFAIVGSREVTEVVVEGAGGPLRTTTRELRLRADRAGDLVIGPVRARQGGGQTVATDPIAVTVDSAAPGVAARLSPLARGRIATAPAPLRNDRVALTVTLPGDTVIVGQQLDIVAAAWFPRELRAQLRRAPIITLQTPEGVWGYPGAAPAEVAASRLVRGEWMDLFVAHQVVFPLAAGRIVIPPAAVDYAVPTNFSFFSREDRYSLKSDSVPVTVLPLPQRAVGSGRSAGGPSADDQQVVAQGLTLDVSVAPPDGRVGEPLDVTATVAGVGNVALWPEPAIRWPLGFRAYPGETGMRLVAREGRIAGTKIFHYLVVPDSAGSFLLPEVRYPYYDVAAGGYAAALAIPHSITVAPGAEPRAARALPPLLSGRAASWTDELASGLVPWGWLALLAGPPLLAWLTRQRAPRALQRVSPESRPRTRLGYLEWEFHTLLASHVPDRAARDGDGLARALRAAGVESAVADHVMRLRDRLRAARYGPQGMGDAAELAAEVGQVLRVLGAEPGAGGDGEAPRRRRAVTTLGLAALLLPGLARAQAPSAEALYEAGALRAAADSFAARAAAEPRIAAHWYNLGATLYRAGADGKAAAAWTVAARLAPRASLVRRERALLPAPDAASEVLLEVGPWTPGEWALVAAAGWLLLWSAVVARRRRAVVAALAVVTAGALGLAGRERLRLQRPLAVVIGPGTAVRVAPYGQASAAATVEAGAALLIERRYGDWLAVRRRDGVRGWVLGSEVVRL